MTVPSPPPVTVPVPDPANAWDILNAIAQSVGALGTTGALIVAAVAYRRQVQDHRRAQASRMTVSFVDSRNEVIVRNNSDLPVYNVSFQFRTYFSVRTAGGRRRAPFAAVDGPRTDLPVLDPGVSITNSCADWYAMGAPPLGPQESPESALEFTLEFDDAAGLEWCRTLDGLRLTRRYVFRLPNRRNPFV